MPGLSLPFRGYKSTKCDERNAGTESASEKGLCKVKTLHFLQQPYINCMSMFSQQPCINGEQTQVFIVSLRLSFRVANNAFFCWVEKIFYIINFPLLYPSPLLWNYVLLRPPHKTSILQRKISLDYTWQQALKKNEFCHVPISRKCVLKRYFP